MASSAPSSAGQTSNITSDTLTQRDLNEYLPLYKAILQGDWKATKEILDNDPNTSKARINCSRHTALHIAIATHQPYHFVKNLVDLMPDDESIGLKDDGGNTALSIAAADGNKEAANLLVYRMNSLLYVADSFGNFPVHQAAQFPNKDMLEYLMAQTRDDLDINPYAGTDGLRLLTYVIDAEFFDVAIILVERYPHVAKLKLPDGTSALKKIAAKRSPFLNANDITFQKSILFFSGILKDKSLLIRQAIELVKCLCKIMGSMSHEEAADIYNDAILMATQLGSYEVVKQIVGAFPGAIYCSTPSSKQSIFHIAILNRSLDVFNLIYMSDRKHLYLNTVDSDGNNLLHAAAKLAQPHKVNEVSGAALKMQHEIHWFRAMERVIHPKCRHQPNKAGKTPKMVFEEEHMKLKEEAVKWTKDTANSCMVVAALIAGAAFTGSITIPGGENSNSGLPIFSKRSAFFIYEVSNCASFFMATFCLSNLLFIFISRYADEDFLLSIPGRLIFTFYILFGSVTMMIVSFFAATDVVLSNIKGAPHQPTAPILFFAVLPMILLLIVYLSPLRHYFDSMYSLIETLLKTGRHS